MGTPEKVCRLPGMGNRRCSEKEIYDINKICWVDKITSIAIIARQVRKSTVVVGRYLYQSEAEWEVFKRKFEATL